MSLEEITACLLLDNPLSLELLLLKSLRERKIIAKFDINKFDREECMKRFRFDQDDLERLKRLLQIPDTIRFNRSTARCTGMEALCILLRRLAYPIRLKDLEPEFDRTATNISAIVNGMLRYVYRRFSYKLLSLDQPWLTRDHLELFARAIQIKGSPLNDCWGFIDGTVRPICRPIRNQHLVYNGHKRVHALKYQTVVTPNGLIANVYGPMPGRRHDSFMLAESGLLNSVEDLKPYYMFADCGYPLKDTVIVPYKPARTEREEEFNKVMSEIRVAVEWPYGKVLQLFAFVDFKKNQKLYLQPVGLYYLIACLLTNCHTCIYGNQGGQYFGVAPPTLEEYLNLDC